MTATLDEIAQAIVADGKGVLAADETPATLTKRLAALGIESTADSRRAYREMLFTTPGIAEYIGGVILQDETIRQHSSTALPWSRCCRGRGSSPASRWTTAPSGWPDPPESS